LARKNAAGSATSTKATPAQSVALSAIVVWLGVESFDDERCETTAEMFAIAARTVKASSETRGRSFHLSTADGSIPIAWAYKGFVEADLWRFRNG
jgi:hypothetical protein